MSCISVLPDTEVGGVFRYKRQILHSSMQIEKRNPESAWM